MSYEREFLGKKGFTLVELLISISVVGILIVGITDFYLTIVSSRVKNQTIAEVERQGAATIALISQRIRNAESISAPAPGSSAASLTLDAVDAGNDPTTIDGTSSRLRITEGLANPVFLTAPSVTLSDLTFTNLSRASTPGIMRVSFTLTRVHTEGSHEYDYAKTFTTSASVR